METRQNQKPLSPSERNSLDGFPAPDGVHYAGHSKHCECEKIAKEFERAYAERTRKMALLERVARAAQSHHHHENETECAICIYLRELDAS